MSNVLVVSAHAMDWVWRCGGAILKSVERGDEVTVLTLSMGARGESRSAWAQDGQTFDNVCAMRLDEAKRAAAIAGVELLTWDWGDYPMEADTERKLELVKLYRELRPDTILTHPRLDPNNPDHVLVADTVEAAGIWARADGRMPELPPVFVTRIFGFEPEFPELCSFRPDTYLDISDVFERKLEMMRCSEVQSFMVDVYANRAQYRAVMAGMLLGRRVTHAEAYERFLPYAGDVLV